MANPVVHWEISTKDAAGLQGFFEKMFDWDVKEMSEMNYRMVEGDGENAIGGGFFQAEGEIPQYSCVYVQVDDVQAYLDKAESNGGKALMGPQEVPNAGTLGHIMTPQGDMVGLWKPAA